ncbi:pesticidal crystal protein cry25Aa [Striga asiatica]|uniref:Pesticidal crystal protein cry25Aa n=1 Tax=Striga asiatica TaxID=4170 RepID=A0A5A7Q379_STRAF|nr:pesticidal crystal protein cry25Aa [Striga asiatica]
MRPTHPLHPPLPSEKPHTSNTTAIDPTTDRIPTNKKLIFLRACLAVEQGWSSLRLKLHKPGFSIRPDTNNWTSNSINLTLASSFGISPDSLLFERFKYVSLGNFPISGGMRPENPFSDKSINVSCARSPIVDGISPLKLFPCSRISVNFDNLFIHEGSTPENSFPLVTNLPRLCNSHISSGSSPEKLLPEINICWRLFADETDCGICPWSLLFESSIYSSKPNPHSLSGTVPDNWLFSIRNRTKLVHSP